MKKQLLFCALLLLSPMANLFAQCTMGYTGAAGGTSYPLNISYIQTFKPTCSGNLSSIVAGPFNGVTDDLRGSSYYVVARIRSATGTILATSAKTDQIYYTNLTSNYTVTFDFSCSNVYLTSGMTYQMELYESTGTTPLYLLGRTTSSQYADGNAILDGTSFPASDIRNLQAVVVSTSLAPAAATKTQDVSCGLFTNASSQIIAQVSPGTISGSTTAKLFFESAQPAQFVTRHYEIAPASNGSTATGTVTLYFTQAEFDAFNAVNSQKLPTGPSDNAGVGRLLIERRIGTSNNNTGLPTTYAGAGQNITPASVVWNAAASRWEVIFSTTGFGGFFVKTQTGAISANTAPMATANTNQTATVGTAFSYTANAFTDAETPASLTYTASINPTNGLSFNPLTRAISGTPTNTGVSSVTVVATDPGSLSASTTFTITAICPTITAVLTGTTTICRGSATNLSATLAGGTAPYSLTYSTGTSTSVVSGNTLTFAVSPTASTTYTIIALRDANGCTATTSGTAIVTVTQPPTPSMAGASQTITTGNSAPLAANAPTTGTGSWSVASGPSTSSAQFSSATNPAATFTPAGGGVGNYVLTWTIANAPCAASASSLTITVNPRQVTALVVTLTANPTTILTTGTSALSATASGGTPPYSYVFSGPGTITGSGTNTATVSGQTSGIRSFTVRVTDSSVPPFVVTNSDGASGQVTTATVSVTVNEPNTAPVANGNANQTATVGTAFAYTATAFTDAETPGSLTYTASISPANGLRFNPDTRVISGTPTSPGVSSVTLVATDPGSLSASTTFTITVSPPPCGTLTAGLTNNGPLSCSLTSVTLTASGGSAGETLSYQFSSGASQRGSGPTATVSSAGVYTVVVTGANSCTASATTEVFINTTAPTVSLGVSNSLNCAVTTATLSATATGFGSLTYAFSSSSGLLAGSPSSSSTLSINSGGSYSVTVTAANGCTATASTVVNQNNTAPTASLVSSGNLSCAVTSVTLTASPSGQSAYGFSTGATRIGTTNQATVNASGTYSVTVTTANGCSATASTVVSQDNTVPTASLVSSGNLTCSVTSVTLTASGGSSYSFSGPGITSRNGNTAVVNTSGTYSVTVTTANGCSATASTVVSQDNTVPTASLVSSGNLTCSVTSITLTASGGSSYTFTAPGGAVLPGSGNTRVVSSPGSYSVSVASANGCTSVASVSVSQDNTAPTASLVSSGNLTCSVTSVTLTASGGSSYSFSGPGITSRNGNTAVVNTSGTYSVTVTTANGCSATASVSVSQDNTVPTASLVSSGNLTCSVTSVTLTASGGSSYSFSGPGITSRNGNTAVVNTSGTYSVTVTTANGCSATASTVVSQDNTVPTASLVSSGNLTCSVTSITLTASGGSSYTFTAPGGAVLPGSGNTRVVSSPGSYSVSVASANGCTSVASVSVSQDNTAPTASLVSSGNLTCSVTSVTLTASGGSSYSFSGPGITSRNGNTAVVNTSGTYSVTVTTANGCSATASTVVSQDNTAPTASLVSSGSLTCSVTSITLTASGGTSYTFTAPGGAVLPGSGNTRVVSSPGSYSVSVASANGCTSVASVSVSQDNTAPTASLVSSGNLTCSVTSVTLTASGGSSYSFSGPGITSRNGNTAVVNTSGTYSVTVTTANGCSATASVSVSQDNTVPTASLVSSGNLTCSVTSVTLTASGGSSYSFSGPGITSRNGNTAVVNTSGTYSVTVTTANGCSATASTVVSQDNTVPTASLVSSGNLTCSVTSITLTAIGGTSYTFTAPGGAVLPGSGNTRVVSSPGSYSVSVASANGCTSVASVSVSQDNTAPTASLVSSGNLTCSVTSVTLTASGGSSYSFSGPGITSRNGNTAVVNTSGTYSVTVTTANGCSATASTIVNQDNNVPMVSIAANPSLTIAQGQTTTLTASVAGGMAPITYAWSTLETTPAISVNMAATYSVTVTAANGCSAVASAVVRVTAAPVVSGPFAITGVTTLGCTAIGTTKRVISFTPQYSGLNGQPVSFSVVGELVPTTNPGPYSLQLYTDNPVIVLKATQAGTPGMASFSYNWLAICNGGVTPPPSVSNTAPTVVSPVGNQMALTGQGYTLSVAGVFTDAETPSTLTLTASGLPTGLILTGTTISGTPSQSGVSTVTLTATDPGQLSASTSFVLTVTAPTSPTSTGSFAIVGVSTITCTTIVAGRIDISFTPQYTGLNGSPLTFSVANELAPTTASGPYSLQLYLDNPSITLRASQSGAMTSFAYNWLVACQSGSNPTPGNTAPRVVQSVSPQSATVGVGYSISLSGVFTDTETPTGLVLTASGLPAGLNLTGTTLSGTPSASGISTVTITATDPGNLAASTSFVLTVSPATSQTTTPPVTPPSGFTITGVQTLSCVVMSASQRSVTFTPQYAGLNGQPVSFSVVNELATTTSPGPYTLRLYTDNPVITLKATQAGTAGVVSFAYNWQSACGSGSRQGASPDAGLDIVVYGNPVTAENVDVEVRGVQGQPLRLTVVNERGYPVSTVNRESAAAVERIPMRVGSDAGLYFLRVSTTGQQKTIKLLKQ